MADYTNKCGSCVYFTPITKDGMVMKRGSCSYKTKQIYHDASQKACKKYFNKEDLYIHEEDLYINRTLTLKDIPLPEMDYIIECAKSVGIEIIDANLISLSVIAEIMRRLREKEQE